jgi:hypothetical protein
MKVPGTSGFAEKNEIGGNRSPRGASNGRMTTQIRTLVRTRFAPFVVLALIAMTSRAATIWTGPNITYTKSASTPSDVIIPGKVVLQRGSRQVLYNTAAGETSSSPDAVGSVSPKDTMWAFGTLANAQSLSYQTMESLRNGNLAARIINQNMVVHLINEDIYFSIKFTVWGRGSGTVSYTRSTAPAANPPTVSISSPTEGAVFANPATITLTANASVTGGTVTNVEYFAGTTSLGKATTSPFSVTAALPGANTFALTAVATAAGLSSTSTVVHVSVVAPVDVSLTTLAAARGVFAFSYSNDPGLRYVIESSSDLSSLANWTRVVTNMPTANPATFSEPFSSTTPARFFRVGRLPNQ